MNIKGVLFFVVSFALRSEIMAAFEMGGVTCFKMYPLLRTTPWKKSTYRVIQRKKRLVYLISMVIVPFTILHGFCDVLTSPPLIRAGAREQ